MILNSHVNLDMEEAILVISFLVYLEMAIFENKFFMFALIS